jgi:hypothetical protein
MVSKIIGSFAVIALSTPLLGQITDKENDLRATRPDSSDGWKTGGVVMVNFSQTSLTNWAQGGDNSLSGNGMVNLFANYKKGSLTWDNTLGLGYGLLRQGSETRKSDDKIDLSTKVGKAASTHWYYAGLLNFKTQFRPGYNYPNDSVVISNFMAPAYFVAAVGMDYRFKKHLSVFISPLSGRLTIVNNKKMADAGAFGVDPAVYQNGIMIANGKRSRQEFGGYVKIAFQKDIMSNVNLTTKVDAFSNYLRKPENIAVNWELLLSLKVNKYIGASVATQLIYDDAVKYKDKGPRIQFKEVIGVGFSYKF